MYYITGSIYCGGGGGGGGGGRRGSPPSPPKNLDFLYRTQSCTHMSYIKCQEGGSQTCLLEVIALWYESYRNEK